MPDGAGPTGMPDWSIGLEMQFYASFPFLVLVLWKSNPIPLTIFSGLAAFIFWKMWGVYAIDTPGLLGLFYQPTLLPFMLPLFTIGMSIAWLWWKYPQSGSYWLWTSVFSLCTMIAYERGHFFASITFLCACMGMRGFEITRLCLDKFLCKINESSDNIFWRWMAKLSYGVYLSHPMVQSLILPEVNRLDLNSLFTFIVLAILTIIGSYLASAVLYFLIEDPIIRWSKSLTSSSVQPTRHLHKSGK